MTVDASRTTRLTPAERRELIERYRSGPTEVEAALAAVADSHTAAEGWTPAQVVHHLADAEARAALRLRQLMAEDKPLIQAYDENLWVRVLPPRPQLDLDVLRAVRANTADLLDRLDPDDDTLWARAGRHEESGSYGMEDWLRIYAAHCHEHARQIRDSQHR